MSDIPKAREIITDVMGTLEATGMMAQANALHDALILMTRRPMAKPRAPARSRFADSETAQLIRQHAAQSPHLSIVELAEVYGVNPGRVSEALHHDR